MGAKSENIVFNLLTQQNLFNKKIGYYSERYKEVDFIIGDYKNFLPVEVKYLDDININDKRLKGIIYFMKKNKLKRGIIITRGYSNIEKDKNIELHFIPLYKILIEDFDIKKFF